MTNLARQKKKHGTPKKKQENPALYSILCRFSVPGLLKKNRCRIVFEMFDCSEIAPDAKVTRVARGD